MSLKREEIPFAGCPACLGCGTTTEPPLPDHIRDGLTLLEWAAQVGAKSVPCPACSSPGAPRPAKPARDRKPDTPGLTPAGKIAQIGSYGRFS